MFKRPLCEMALGFLFGMLYAAYKKWYFLAVMFGMLCCMLYTYFWKKKTAVKTKWFFAARMVSAVLFFVLGVFRFQVQETSHTRLLERISDEMYVTVQGTVSSVETKNQNYLYQISNCFLSIGQEILPCSQILFYQDTENYSIGQTLIVNGTIKLWEGASNEGNFDARSYYESKKIEFQLNDAHVTAVYGRKENIRSVLYKLRTKISQVYQTYLNAKDAGVLSAMVLGEKSLLDTHIKELYQKAGISHVLAISGLHISIIGMGFYQLLRKCRLSFFSAGIFSALMIGGYGVMCGFGTSTQRAVFMFFVMLFGQWIGRSYDSLSALALCVIVLLWNNCYLLWNTGFLFSFAAVLSIVGVGNTMIKIKKPYFSFAETLLLNFSIQLVTVPLTAYFYYEVPLWGMVVNFFVLPVIGALLFCGLLGGIIGLFFSSGAKILLSFCHFILLFCEKMSLLGTNLPKASLITGKPMFWKMAVFYSVLCVLIVFFQKRKSRSGFFTAGILLLCFVLYNPMHEFELDVLDVGQGDAIYLHTKNGTDFFFDGGSSNVSGVGSYCILPFLKAKGVKKIDYWIVSHTDADHISGLLEVLQADYPVKNLVFSKYVKKDEVYETLTALAQEHQTAVIKMDCGERLLDEQMYLECIFPDKNYETEDKNALSLVLRYEDASFSALFTGDIGIEEETYLLEKGAVKPVSFYKAAHHGSNYSNSKAFLAALSPHISVISCSKTNRYGHPGVQAIEHITESGSKIYTTMNGGRIKIRSKDGEILAEQYVSAF